MLGPAGKVHSFQTCFVAAVASTEHIIPVIAIKPLHSNLVPGAPCGCHRLLAVECQKGPCARVAGVTKESNNRKQLASFSFY